MFRILPTHFALLTCQRRCSNTVLFKALLLFNAFLLVTLLLLFTTTRVEAAVRAVTWPPIDLVTVEGGFSRPVNLISPNDGSNRLFVVEQGGVIYIIEDGERLSTPFLDISARASDPVDPCGECGLLGLAFPPDFAEEGYFFVNYTSAEDLIGPDPGDADPTTIGDTVVARFHVTANPNIADPDSEERILIVNQPAPNHNGGHILFGPDDKLYIGMGDGGGGGDTYQNAQNPASLLGKILRIQVSETATYTIPSDNPFIEVEGYRDEIWVMGLRNPWRYTFDRATGDLYVADVGDRTVEEVNYVAAAAIGDGGMNFGWPIREGNVCFPPDGPQTCNTTGLTEPVVTYVHSAGNCSITGGYVYDPAPANQPPIYLYGDLCSGRVWGMQLDGPNWVTTELKDLTFNISSFGEDANKGLYIVSLAGTIYQIEGSIAQPITGLSATNDGPSLVDTATAFTATVTGGTHISYQWDFGDGSNDGSNSATAPHTYSQSGVYTATVVASNATNSLTSTTTVYVGDAVVDVSSNQYMPKQVTIPIGGSVVWVRVEGSHSVTEDSLRFNQPLNGNWSTFVQSFNSADEYPYHCTLHGAAGGINMAGTVIVDANLPPDAITGLAASNDGPTTLGSTTSFAATVTDGDHISYTWSFGDGSSAMNAGATPTHSYSQSGIYTTTVVASNATNSISATTTVYVGDQVVAVTNDQYTPNNFTIAAGETVIWELVEGEHSVTADDNSFNQPLGSDWPPFAHTFGDTSASAAGLNDSTISFHCTLHPAMTGTVTLLQDGPEPVVGVNAENDGPKQTHEAVAFAATVTSGTEITYGWDFGDGDVGTGITTTHAYDAAGIYTATVTATNASNSLSATTTVYVGDAVVAVADFAYTPRAVTLPVGSMVVWVLRNGTHSVTADDNSFEQPAGSDWSPFVQSFDSVGEVPYHCTLHGSAGGNNMAGTVTVEERVEELNLPNIRNRD